jgi:hypothetical protein
MNKHQPMPYTLPDCESCIALRARIAALECENERLKSEMGYHEAKDVIAQLSAQLASMKQDERNQFDVMWGIVNEFGITQRGAGCPDAQIRDHITDLLAQLAAMKLERAELARKYALVKDDPDYAQCCQIRERAEQQLATAQDELRVAMRQGGTRRTELMLENRDLREQLAAVTKERDALKACNETQRLSIKSYQKELGAGLC